MLYSTGTHYTDCCTYVPLFEIYAPSLASARESDEQAIKSRPVDSGSTVIECNSPDWVKIIALIGCKLLP